MVGGEQGVLAEVAAQVDDVAGLGLTGQMHGSVFLDAAAEVIRPALLWNDQRTAAECDEITERVGAGAAAEIAGNPALTGFQAPKIRWLAHDEPDDYARVASVLLPKDYVRLMLTGEHATDASDAVGHAAARRPRARLGAGDPGRAGDPARVAAEGHEGPR